MELQIALRAENSQRAETEFGKHDDLKATLNLATCLTGHSARGTMLSLHAHHDAGHVPLMLQGHWKSSAMQAKHVRDKGHLAARHVADLAGSSAGNSGEWTAL